MAEIVLTLVAGLVGIVIIGGVLGAWLVATLTDDER